MWRLGDPIPADPGGLPGSSQTDDEPGIVEKIYTGDAAEKEEARFAVLVQKEHARIQANEIFMA